MKWTKKKNAFVEMAAEGEKIVDIARKLNMSIHTAYHWNEDPLIREEIDRLSLMSGIASKAERMRIAKKAARQKMLGDHVRTKKDLLDWLKFASKEMEGERVHVHLNIADVISSLDAQREKDEGASEKMT